jgi:ketosteroid isomerase-like protein
MLAAVPAVAGPAEDATAFINGVMDKFNNGDAKSFVSAHEDNAVIVDEFAPHVWVGAGAAQRWLDDYAKDSKANGVSGGRVDYGKAIQANSDGSTSYVVLPTTYHFTKQGKKMIAPGSMTFVVKRAGEGWKIASWTYSGATAAPEK